jgi:hypothetical protein
MKLPADHSAATLLRRALLSNTAFSALCGVLIIVFDQSIVSLVTTVEYQLWPLGVMLIGFASSLLWFATRASLSVAWVRSVIAADFAWVVGTVVLLVGWHDLLSSAGIGILIAVAAAVLLFGELQWVGLRRLRRTLSTA